MSKKILVISSANMDFVMAVGAIPLTGQTMVESRSYKYVPGGKGANSALAFARLGADSVFCTRLGRDANGEALRGSTTARGLTPAISSRMPSSPPAWPSLWSRTEGQTASLSIPGANGSVCRADIEAALACKPDAVFMQLEIGEQAILDAAELTAERGIRSLSMLAPAALISRWPSYPA